MTERTGKKDDRIGIATKTKTKTMTMTMTTTTMMTMTTETIGGGGIVTAMMTGGGDAIEADEFIEAVCIAGANRRIR